MRKLSSLLLAAVLCRVPLASAAESRGLDEAFAAAEAAARQASADLCAENKELESRVFGFELQQNKLSPGISLRFAFTGCEVIPGRLGMPPFANRAYASPEGYELVLYTEEGSAKTYARIMRDDEDAAILGGFPTADLLKGSLDVSGASLVDPRSGKTYAGAAAFWSESPSPAPDAPKSQE